MTMKSRACLTVASILALVLLWACAEAPDRETPAAADLPPAQAELYEDAPEWLAALAPHRALDDPQTLSLFGDELYAQEDTTGQIADADRALMEDLENVDLLIDAGRVRRNFWHYRQAMELYTRAAELAPEDWRPYRFRGHRHMSLRQFDQAIDDLERARDLAPLNWDVAYHLALAYFYAGRFDDAADEYVRCLDLADDPEAQAADSEAFRSCSANGDDPESMVAMTEWAVRSLMRAGRHDEAEALLSALPDDLSIQTNVAYHHNLLVTRGEMDRQEVLDPGPDGPYRRETVGYGVANLMIVEGDTTGAVELLRELMDDPWWPGFGRIAAEVELARLEGTR
jgi:tetratricopeptide (TPR) repeat protein